MLQRVLIITLNLCTFLASADDTVLKLYRPFGETIDQVPLTVTQNVSGHCLSQSKLILREDAWRCTVNDHIYDPCFHNPAGSLKEVICPQSPWNGESVRINLDSSLNNELHEHLDMSRTYPWGIELSNGERCLAQEGLEAIDGMPVRYRCSGSNVMMGYLQRCKPVWSMLEKTPVGINSIELSRAWF